MANGFKDLIGYIWYIQITIIKYTYGVEYKLLIMNYVVVYNNIKQ